MKYDFLIIGAGLYGSVFARTAAEFGWNCLIIEQRNHIAGNCYSQEREGIQVHEYGPHTFHTNNDAIWEWVNRFAKFNHFRLHAKARYQGQTFSFPINLMTLQQIYGIGTPEEARKKLDSLRVPCDNPNNLEEWILSQVGPELYEIFIKGYSSKQWGRAPKDLPASIIKRIPIRLTYNDRYHDDKYEGVPIGGYTKMFENMLDHKYIKVQTGVDFFDHRNDWINLAKRIVFTGKIDEWFDYKYGELEYRSLRFEHEVLDGDFQGTAQVNYTDSAIPFTRIVEHKHFEFQNTPKTVITKEYPLTHSHGNQPFYPIRDEKNTAIFEKYWQEAKQTDTIFGGRLARYMYLDMHQVIAQAQHDFENQDFLPLES